MLDRGQSLSEGSVRFLVGLKLYFAVRPERDALTAEEVDQPDHKTLRALNIPYRYPDHHHDSFRHRFGCAGLAPDIMKRMTRQKRYV
jgi:hypothetical protein